MLDLMTKAKTEAKMKTGYVGEREKCFHICLFVGLKSQLTLVMFVSLYN